MVISFEELMITRSMKMIFYPMNRKGLYNQNLYKFTQIRALVEYTKKGNYLK